MCSYAADTNRLFAGRLSLFPSCAFPFTGVSLVWVKAQSYNRQYLHCIEVHFMKRDEQEMFMGTKKEVLSTVKIQKAPDVYKMVDSLKSYIKRSRFAYLG